MTDAAGPRVLQHGARVALLSASGAPLGELPWEAALELGRALLHVSRPGAGEVERVDVAGARRRVLRESDAVTVHDHLGALCATMTPTGALALGRALVAVAHKAEEWAVALAVAYDAAILLRTGAPFGLTSQPDILKEAVKLARDDRDLRRWLPGGIRSQEIVGEPTLIVGPPPQGGKP